MDKLGIGRDTISLGASSNFMNTTMKFTDADKTKLREFGAGIYQRFVQKVADSRKKSFEDTRALAKGRVWTGTAAKQAGLVDINGGLLDAIKVVKRRIGADENKKVMVYSYPEKIDNLAAILKMFGIDDSNGDDEEVSAPRVTIPMLLERAMGSPSAVEQAVKAMPADARRQFEHAAALANIGLTERAMIMMPMLVPNE
jgi:ClpP class serine protease